MEAIMKTKQAVEHKLKELKLNGVLAQLFEQENNITCSELPFLERLNHLLDNQVVENDNKRIALLRRQAALRWADARISDTRYDIQTGLKESVTQQLIQFNWIRDCRHLIITGKTGCGKTRYGCAIANAAIKQKISVGFYRFSELIALLVMADDAGKLVKIRNKLKRFKLLFIDDWGISPLNVEQRHLLFELIEFRDQKGSLIITSQYPVGDWYGAFGDETIADSTLDRIVHSAHKISMKGESFRKLMGIKGGLK
jgi:DNA replication protein DnaC